MKSIVLPAGTEHVQFGELAHCIADALWPDAGPDDDRMTNAFARINLDAELARAVDSGALPVKDPLTLGPHTYPVGNALRTALVTVDDLQRFVSDRGLSVIVETTEPQTLPVPHVGALGGVKWTPEKLAELSAYRDGHTMPETALKFGISEQRIRQLLPSDKPKATPFAGLIRRTK